MRQITKICTLLMTALLVFSLGVTASAEGTVYYEGNAREFIFAPGSIYSPTDLFSDFKGVMPGDSITQQILVKNDASHGVKITVYMRSLGAQENTDDFLSQLYLTVAQRGDSIMFAAPADETAQLTDWVCLGTIYSGGEITLDVTLDVPITLGNEYQHEIGYIDWEFKVEEFPIGDDDPEVPKTGDDANVLLYAGLMLASLLAMILLLLANKRQKNKQKDENA